MRWPAGQSRPQGTGLPPVIVDTRDVQDTMNEYTARRLASVGGEEVYRTPNES